MSLHAPAFKVGDRSIPERAALRRPDNNSNVVTSLPKRLEQAKLRNLVMKIVRNQHTESSAVATRKPSASAMTQEDLSAFKGNNAAQQDFMLHLRGYEDAETEKEVSKMTTVLLRE